MGLEPIDVGPVKQARYLEGMLILWINNRFVNGQPFDYYLRKVQGNRAQTAMLVASS